MQLQKTHKNDLIYGRSFGFAPLEFLFPNTMFWDENCSISDEFIAFNEYISGGNQTISKGSCRFR